MKLIVIRQYVCHMWLLNIDQIGHSLSQVEVLDEETLSACSENALGVHLSIFTTCNTNGVCERVAVIEVSVMTCSWWSEHEKTSP